MAWRIDQQVVRGEIDSRQRGQTTGRLWLANRAEPVELELEGSPWADLAGHLLRFHQPRPQAGPLDGLAPCQRGVVGDITASRKVKVSDTPVEERHGAAQAGRPSYHWANCLYLEWFSEANGRVVIESTDFELELNPDPSWTMTADEELAQRARNAEAMTRFMDRLSAAHAGAVDDEDFDDDAPQSTAEAEAEAQTAWMDKLLDRIEARIEREGFDEDRYDEIYHEERERLRRETGHPPEPEDTPEAARERQQWIDEMNELAAEAMAELEAEAWKDRPEPRRPELLDRATDLAVALFHDVAGWMPDDSPREHPLREIVNGVQIASAKLAGALGHDADEPWPPDALTAGDTLVRLKKARDALRDALRGLDSADEEQLAETEWRIETRRAVADLLGEVQRLIAEVREVLRDD
ncbi:hypothetical protein [Haloferula sargassicola]|uniref:Uncharacterized protein n=1 Tax=Haloferula sargassicola TaxID=490096 RepID=A0ABP9UP04_9BACT